MSDVIYQFDDYYKSAIKESFEKIRITDGNINKKDLELKILLYYKNKFESEMLFYQEKFNGFDFVDLFCGAGGLSEGLEQRGLKTTLAIDKDKSALQTYRFNRPWLSSNRIINEDIRTLVENVSFDFVPLVVGGPPCQGFSNANKHRKAHDERNELYKYYIRSVSHAQPDIFLIENVEGILTHLNVIRRDFAAINYKVFKPIILNTSEFGFPQKRKRAFILGTSNKYANIFDEIYQIFIGTILSRKSDASFNLWDAISDLPIVEAKTERNRTYDECKKWGFTYGGFFKPTTNYSNFISAKPQNEVPILNHKSKYNNTRDIEIFRLLSPGEKSDAESIQDINPYKSRSNIFVDKFYKLQPDEPCKTITAHMYYDCNMYIHPYLSRGLTPREAARIQGFPDDYLFLGSPNEWYRQIGNAVSPLLARVLGEALKNVLQRIYRV